MFEFCLFLSCMIFPHVPQGVRSCITWWSFHELEPQITLLCDFTMFTCQNSFSLLSNFKVMICIDKEMLSKLHIISPERGESGKQYNG